MKCSVLAGDFEKYADRKLISMSEDEIAYSYPIYAEGIGFPSLEMQNLTMHYPFITANNEKPEDKTRAAANIMRFMKKISEPEVGCEIWRIINKDMYFISKETIWNTRALLANSAKIKFDEWEDLDALEKRLDAGERIFKITQNNGGDGCSNTAIYGFGGWNTQFNSDKMAEVLYAEIL